MSENDLNLNFETEVKRPHTPSIEEGKAKASIFKFDIRSVLIWLCLKWRWILLVFFFFLAVFWSFLQMKSKYSDEAWSAASKIFHQSRSERVPSFYKPVDTATVMQFASSHDVLARAGERLSAQYPAQFSKDLLKRVEMGIDRNRKNIITITAMSNNPKIAVDIANIVAEEGISEYVRRQNNSMRIMSEERKAQRQEIDKEIDSIQDQKKKYYSKKSGLPPDLETDKVREEISSLLTKRDDSTRSLQSIESRIGNVQEAIKVTPPKIEFETVMDNSKSIGLDGKRKELEKLRKRYTEENPKVIILRSEIEDLERETAKGTKEVPAKVTYRINDIYSDLQAQLANLNLEKAMMKTAVENIDVEVDKKRQLLEQLQETNKSYSAILRHETMLKEKSSRLSEKINDIDFLVGSAVPDVSLLEAAKVPYYNIQKVRIKIIAFTILTTMFFVAILAAYRIARMKLLSSNDFALAFGLENIGEIPLLKEDDQNLKMSSMQTILRNIKTFSSNSKRVAFLKFDGDTLLDEAINEFSSIAAVKGTKAFRLKCVLAEAKEEDNRVPDPNDKVAASLISAQKFADEAVFVYQNKYCLDVVECDLLGFDIDVLSREYDVLTVELNCCEGAEQLSGQIAHLCDYVIISAAFDKTGKFQIQENIAQIKEVSKSDLGGILTNVPKPYFKK